MQSRQVVFAVGQPAEIAHHVQPFAEDLSVRIAEPDQVLAEARAGDVAIFYSEHFDRFRHCCVELKKRQVATLYLLDGILEWRNAFENHVHEPACPWTMRTVLSHKVACIGASQQRMLDAWGNQGKTEVVGIPRLENLCQGFVAGAVPPRVTTGPFRVLVATAKTPGFTPEQVATTRQALQALRDFLPGFRLPDGRPVEVHWRVCGGLAEELGLPNQVSDLAGDEALQQLQKVSALITTPSTLMLEGQLLDRPTAVLNFHNSPLLVTSPWQLQHPSQFAAVLAELAAPPAAKMELQRMWLRDALYCESNSVQRMVELIELMKQEARQAVLEQRPLAFAPGLLESPRPQPAGFSSAALYPEYREWGFDSAEQMAGELAQSRREISHLQRELRQARAELAQAHQIFDEIRKHPIAGPIVRLRESVLSFLKRTKERTPATAPDALPDISEPPAKVSSLHS